MATTMTMSPLGGGRFATKIAGGINGCALTVEGVASEGAGGLMTFFAEDHGDQCRLT
ncbi:MAG: hypothetical protein H7Z10_15565, partial [Gemmatimonadaceae bacterium]|nr:hypothetical protein [Acetobacteraceae bacterium]